MSTAQQPFPAPPADRPRPYLLAMANAVPTPQSRAAAAFIR